MFSFLDIVKGTLSQTNSTSAQRRKAVMGALDAFKGFLVMALDAVDSDTKEKSDESLDQLKEMHRLFNTSKKMDIVKLIVP